MQQPGHSRSPAAYCHVAVRQYSGLLMKIIFDARQWSEEQSPCVHSRAGLLHEGGLKPGSVASHINTTDSKKHSGPTDHFTIPPAGRGAWRWAVGGWERATRPQGRTLQGSGQQVGVLMLV